MKRLDEEPTCEIARESLKHDQLGRREIVAQFIHLLYSVKGPYSIFIDAPWGTGKTFFVKQIIDLDSHFHCNSLRTQRNALR